MVHPHDDVVVAHELRGGRRDRALPRHHPRHHAHALGEDHGAFRHDLPQRARERLVRRRQHERERDEVHGVRVVDHAVFAAGRLKLHLVVLEVARELARGASAVREPPPDAVLRAGLVDLDDAEGVLRVAHHVAHVARRARDHEELARELRHALADVRPRAGGLLHDLLHVRGLVLRETVAEVAAVHLMPALVHAVLGELHEALCAGHVENLHVFPCLSCHFRRRSARLPTICLSARHPKPATATG